jgi:hypothetical protein
VAVRALVLPLLIIAAFFRDCAASFNPPSESPERRCSEPHPKRNPEYVRALAARQFGCSRVHEEASVRAYEPCGRTMLSEYELWVCGRCVHYQWQGRGVWSILDQWRAPRNGDC